jgi:hypothetical protein
VADAIRFPVADGVVWCDPSDGSVVRIEHPAHPHMTFLYDESVDEFHISAHRWGKGFVSCDRGAARWDAPTRLTIDDAGVAAEYALPIGLELSVTRAFGPQWTESYAVRNTGDDAVRIGGFAVSTPFRDRYVDAEASLSGCCHAHVFAGGAGSYVWAVGMDGTAPGLGLVLTDGELWGYSVESRSMSTNSHVRGHLYLHGTDADRAPDAMGGQPRYDLAPGESLRIGWQIGWYATESEVQAASRLPVEVPDVCARDAIRLVPRTTDVRIEPATGLTGTTELRAQRPGEYVVDVVRGAERSRIGLFFHPPIRDLVEARVRYILRHQRATHRPGSAAGAFLPCDTRTGLPVESGDWSDWSDGRERVAMPRLLQEARRRGWGNADEIDEALAAFSRFAADHLVDENGRVRSGSTDRGDHNRPYNYPWLAAFDLAQWQLYRNSADLESAVRIIKRYYADGGARFLAIGIADCLRVAAAELQALGDPRAGEMVEHARRHADTILEFGRALPPHEVNYEQSIVAPSLAILIAAHELTRDERYAAGIAERLPWLRAFAGRQPHSRLRHVAIRHWDGYWFGLSRMWGDTFPHYWTVLDADVFCRLPDDSLQATGAAILRANLAHFDTDGTATCAFVFPTAVDGRPAHFADVLANDQDWALVYALQLDVLETD